MFLKGESGQARSTTMHAKPSYNYMRIEKQHRSMILCPSFMLFDCGKLYSYAFSNAGTAGVANGHMKST